MQYIVDNLDLKWTCLSVEKLVCKASSLL